jgi:transcription-repair coupling factor (superfamily II helicase)
MEGQQLLLTIDERKTDKQLPFDILEAIMKLLPTAKREESAPVAE